MGLERTDLPSLPKHWEIQAKLPCATVCGFSLTPKVRDVLLGVNESVSVLDLYLHFKGDRRNASIEVALNTPFKVSQVKNSYLKLYEILLNSRRQGRPRSAKLAWVLPDACLNKNSSIDAASASEIEKFMQDALGKTWTKIDRDYESWLPYISLGSANLIRRWRSPRINSLRRAMFRFARKFDAGSNAFLPWEPGYNSLVRRIPVQALYQFEPTKLNQGAIKSFNDLGFTIINDLRCLHPDAVSLVKDKKGRQALFALFRHLH